jgi:hypothetical protein
MPRINLRVLLDHLEGLKDNLSYLWSVTKNYDHLALIEEVIIHLEKIIATVSNVEESYLVSIK